MATPIARRRPAVLFGLLLAAFWPTLLSFPATWSISANEYGFFVAALVAWLLWRDRDRLLREADAPVTEVLPLIALLSIMWLGATIMSVQVVHQGLFVMLATAWAFAVFGWGARVPILAIAATFALAVPAWWVILPLLQRATVLASGGATQLAGITAVIGYDTIAIQSGTFLVAEGCAGLRYLTAGVALGAFYGHLFAPRWQTQLKIVALAAAMSIVGNWIRVTVLIFLGEATAMQSPYIEDHLWQGWMIFSVLMIPTYFLARRIEVRDAARFAGDEAAARVPDDAVTAEKTGGMTRAATFATLAAVVGPVLYMVVGAVPRSEALDVDPDVLRVDPAWSMTPLGGEVDSVWLPDFHGVDHRAAWLVPIDDHEVEVVRHYYQDQRPGEELIQYNNFIAPDSLRVSERVFGPVGPDRRIVREAIVWDADTPRVAWYWYRVGGFDTPFESKAKLLEIVAFFRRSSSAELVTLSARCSPDSCAEAARALRASISGPAALSAAEPGA